MSTDHRAEAENAMPTVSRVNTATGGHIEPRFDEAWSDLEKLRWHAAVVYMDSGVAVQVSAGGQREKRFGRWRDVPGQFSYSLPSGGGVVPDFHTMWWLLNGISLGADRARRVVAS